jgi:putative ABC transport system ATP-binding protein
MQPMLVATNLLKTYQARGAAVQALRGVDVAVARGEFVAVMGPSGCGKSTLLHLVAGLDRPSGGEIWLEGTRVDTLSEAQRAVLRRRQIGLIFQFFNLVGNLTVADNVELPALLAGVPPPQARHQREQLLVDLGISDIAYRAPAELSGGEQQRVAIARALINRPALLLADEPTGNLNSQGAREVLALLSQYHAIGQTILLVSHDARVASAAGRVISMRDGSIIDETLMERDHDSRKVLSRMIQLGG